uniref:Uncharacterized protein n=1 Tax=Aegilops tauschii subsp. strangulata TaxID=200361 RepID=A0A453AYI8_AEGTS
METVHTKEAMGTTCPEDNGQGKDGSTTDEQYDPRIPPSPPSDLKSLKEWPNKTSAIPANSRATSTIIPDGTPQKLFLDTIRLLAKHTDNLSDEVCNYIIDGKLIQTAVLLLAAQEQIRGVSSPKKDLNSKPDEFAIITNCVVGKITSIQLEMCQKGKELEPLEAKKKLFDMTLTLVHVISQAGEALDSYIRDHPKLAASFYQDRALTWKVPCIIPISHVEVLEHVSLILKDYGLCSGEGIDIGNLCPYENVVSSEELPRKLGPMARMKAGTDEPCLENVKAKGKKGPRGWELKLARRSFFPYWRSVLTSQFHVKEDINSLNKSTRHVSTKSTRCRYLICSGGA